MKQQLISNFEAGQRLCIVDIDLSSANVRGYLDLIGDSCDYGNLVPPIVPLAKALGAVVERFRECAGAIHFSENMEVLKLPHIGEMVTADVWIHTVRKRSTNTFLTIRTQFSSQSIGDFLNSETVIILSE